MCKTKGRRGGGGGGGGGGGREQEFPTSQEEIQSCSVKQTTCQVL